MHRVRRISPWFAAVGLAACISSGSPGGDEPGPEGDLILARDYTLSGSSLLVSIPADTSVDCYSGTLKSYPHPARVDTTAFEIRNDSLFVESDSGNFDSAWTMSYMVLKRYGSGSGLTGLWRWVSNEYRVISGIPSAKDIAYFARQHANQDAIFQIFKVILSFDGKSVRWYMDDHAARLFIAGWSQPDYNDSLSEAARYAITVSEADKLTVMLHGEKSGETVWMTLYQNDSTAFRSDRAGNEPHTWRRKPVSCPNPREPAWYGDFLAANAKP